MNKRIKTKWLKALRSGEYKQTKGRLKDSVGYCCLGVLCDLHAKETGNTWDESGNLPAYFGESGTLPDRVVKWSGVPDMNPDIPEHYNLGAYNDVGATFEDIADAIERHL
jgi:hypothetical protein